ncbi:MAG: hypothetical protein R3F59_05080 [Myxococcota bacterium]
MVAVLAGSGCASFATFQEMDTLDKGDGQFGMGATVSGYQVDLGDDPQSFVVPALNLWYRQGVAEHFEVHGRAWLPLGATLGAKYQLLGDRHESGFGVSAGLDLGYLTVSSGDAKSTLVDTYVPIYLGLRASEGFAVYAVPKYLLRTSLGTGGTSLGHLAGGTLGLAAGKKTTFLLEGSGVFDLQGGPPSWTGGLGIGF